jgi:hypothetical protein
MYIQAASLKSRKLPQCVRSDNILLGNSKQTSLMWTDGGEGLISNYTPWLCYSDLAVVQSLIEPLPTWLSGFTQPDAIRENNVHDENLLLTLISMHIAADINIYSIIIDGKRIFMQ